MEKTKLLDLLSTNITFLKILSSYMIDTRFWTMFIKKYKIIYDDDDIYINLIKNNEIWNNLNYEIKDDAFWNNLSNNFFIHLSNHNGFDNIWNRFIEIDDFWIKFIEIDDFWINLSRNINDVSFWDKLSSKNIYFQLINKQPNFIISISKFIKSNHFWINFLINIKSYKYYNIIILNKQFNELSNNLKKISDEIKKLLLDINF